MESIDVITRAIGISWHRESALIIISASTNLSKDESYEGKYVAILHGKVIDSDQDKVKLAERVYENQGYIPIFFGCIGPQRTVETISGVVTAP